MVDVDAPEDLEHPWDAVFALMWEAYLACTIPVGAVVVDGSGAIVARGRNRTLDEDADGQFGHSPLAHAEINAVLGLGSPATGDEMTVYSTLEPCHLCLSAMYTTRVARVRYAAVDLYAGAVGKLVPSADHQAHPVDVVGPLPGAAGLVPELLHLAHMVWRVPKGNCVALYRRVRPRLFEAARQLPPPDAGASLADAFAAVRSLQLAPDGQQ